VRPQLPLALGPSDLPEPDLAVVRGSSHDDAARHPRGRDAVLVIEVSRTSCVRDERKAELFAGAGVPVYWIVDLERGVLRLYEEPAVGGYRRVRELSFGDAVSLPEREADRLVLGRLLRPGDG
jgi:Uma2 family endonuclease